MKIVNIKKFFRSIILLISFIILFTLSISNNISFSKQEISYKEVYTSAGDTLWEIAKEEAKGNEYYSNKDVRYIIKDLKRINNLENSELVIGQKILIPNI